MKSKRKNIFILIAGIILLAAAVGIIYLFNWRNKQVKQVISGSSVESTVPITSSNISTTTPYQPDWSSNNRHPVELKLMTDKEKDQIGLSIKANPARIQVLKRDAKGKITEYKLINNDNDIVKYNYR